MIVTSQAVEQRIVVIDGSTDGLHARHLRRAGSHAPSCVKTLVVDGASPRPRARRALASDSVAGHLRAWTYAALSDDSDTGSDQLGAGALMSPTFRVRHPYGPGPAADRRRVTTERPLPNRCHPH